MHAYIHTYMHTCIHKYISTYIQTCIHTHTHIASYIYIQAEPFIYVTRDENGDEVFEGLCIDLLNKLSDKMGFDYTISLVADGQYGGQLEDGSWTGLVGDLTRRVSH